MDAYFFTKIASSLNAIPPLAEEIQIWGEEHGIGRKAIFRTNLILEELITNIICYGYQGNPQKPIILSIQKSGQYILITLEDEAPKFNPLLQPSAPIHKQIEERSFGGLGIYFARSLSDHIEYQYTGTGNRLTIRIAS